MARLILNRTKVTFGGGGSSETSDWAIVSITATWDAGPCGRDSDAGGTLTVELLSPHAPAVFHERNQLVGQRLTATTWLEGQEESTDLGTGIVSSIRARPAGRRWLYQVKALDAISHAAATIISMPARPPEVPHLRLAEIRKQTLAQCDWDITGAPPVLWSSWPLIQIEARPAVGLLDELNRCVRGSGRVVRAGSNFRLVIGENYGQISLYSGGIRIERGSVRALSLPDNSIVWPREWQVDRAGTVNRATLTYWDRRQEKPRKETRQWRINTSRQDTTWAVDTDAIADGEDEADGMDVSSTMKGTVDALANAAVWRPVGRVRLLLDRVGPWAARLLLQPRSRCRLVLLVPAMTATYWRVTKGELRVTAAGASLEVEVVDSRLSGLRRMPIRDFERAGHYSAPRKWKDAEGAAITFADTSLVGWPR